MKKNLILMTIVISICATPILSYGYAFDDVSDANYTIGASAVVLAAMMANGYDSVNSNIEDTNALISEIYNNAPSDVKTALATSISNSRATNLTTLNQNISNQQLTNFKVASATLSPLAFNYIRNYYADNFVQTNIKGEIGIYQGYGTFAAYVTATTIPSGVLTKYNLYQSGTMHHTYIFKNETAGDWVVIASESPMYLSSYSGYTFLQRTGTATKYQSYDNGSTWSSTNLSSYGWGWVQTSNNNAIQSWYAKANTDIVGGVSPFSSTDTLYAGGQPVVSTTSYSQNPTYNPSGAKGYTSDTTSNTSISVPFIDTGIDGSISNEDIISANFKYNEIIAKQNLIIKNQELEIQNIWDFVKTPPEELDTPIVVTPSYPIDLPLDYSGPFATLIQGVTTITQSITDPFSWSTPSPPELPSGIGGFFPSILSLLGAIMSLFVKVIAFIGQLNSIQPSSSMLNSDMIYGINYARSLAIGGVTLYSLVTACIGMAFGVVAFKLLRKIITGVGTTYDDSPVVWNQALKEGFKEAGRPVGRYKD